MAQIQKGIHPSVEIGGAAQAVAGAGGSGGIFAGVMDQTDRDVRPTLQAAQIAE
jgi:hypothetical protein